MPRQSSHIPSIYNAIERAIVQAEIDELITKSVMVPSSPGKGDFVSTIFLRPKNDDGHRIILNLKQSNEFVEYHQFKTDTLETGISMMKAGCYMASWDWKTPITRSQLTSPTKNMWSSVLKASILLLLCCTGVRGI